MALHNIPTNTWLEFLDQLQGQNLATPEHIHKVLGVWNEIRAHFQKEVLPPFTQMTGEGAVQLAWSSPKQIFDVEIFPDNTVLWFYRNRETREVAGTEDEENPPQALTPEGYAFLGRLLG